MTEENNTLKKIFDDSCNDLTEDVAKHIKFVFEVGKAKISNLLECRKFLGYYSDDEKEDMAEAQNFRNKVLHPLRDHLTRRILSLSKADAEKLWTRDSKSDEDKKNKERILAMLPKQIRRGKEEVDIGEIIGDI